MASHIKSIDPSIKVMFGGTAAPAPITTEIALREGATPYVDATAFHPYGIDKPEGGMGTMEEYQGKSLGKSRQQTGWNHLEEIVAGVKKPFAQHGKPDIAVWLDEWGTNVSGLDFAYNPGIGEYGCAKYMMRFYIYSGWLNLPTAWWALYNENMSQDWGIIDQHDYGLRPMSYALQNVCSVVSDVEPIRTFHCKYDGPAPDVKTIAFKRDAVDETLVLVWAAEMNNEQIKAYRSRLSFELEKRPSRVVLTDLYWGVSQPAVWSYENGLRDPQRPRGSGLSCGNFVRVTPSCGPYRFLSRGENDDDHRDITRKTVGLGGLGLLCLCALRVARLPARKPQCRWPSIPCPRIIICKPTTTVA